MANNKTVQPVAKPPVTAGQAGAAQLAAKPGIASYMKARGAKPADSMGVSAPANPPRRPPVSAGPTTGTSAGNLSKSRRMTTQPVPPQNMRQRRQPQATFSGSNRVPTAGNQYGNAQAALAARRRNNMQPGVMPAGPTRTMDRVRNFMGGRGGTAGPKNPNAGSAQDQNAAQAQARARGGAAPRAFNQLGGSTAGPKNPNAGAVRAAMPAVKNPTATPQVGAPQTAVMPKPGLANTVRSQPRAGGGATTQPIRRAPIANA